jgi:hypothetical protein
LPNIKDEERVHIENNSNLRTPLSTIPAFGTLEWIIEEGWLILPKRKESCKQTPKVSESSKSRKIVDHNLLGLFDQQVFSTKPIYSPIKETTVTTSIVTLTMFVLPIMALLASNVLRIQLAKYHDNHDPVSHL